MDWINEFYEKHKKEIENPDWEKGVHGDWQPKKAFHWVHAWERYVPDRFKECWNDLSVETKCALYYVGEEQAHEEDWD